MNWVVTWLLVGLTVWLLARRGDAARQDLRVPVPGRDHDLFLHPAAVARSGERSVPAARVLSENAIIFTIMRIAVCRFGWMPNRPVMQAFQWRFNEKRLLLVAAVLSLIGAYFYRKLAQIPIDQASVHDVHRRKRGAVLLLQASALRPLHRTAVLLPAAVLAGAVHPHGRHGAVSRAHRDDREAQRDDPAGPDDRHGGLVPAAPVHSASGFPVMDRRRHGGGKRDARISRDELLYQRQPDAVEPVRDLTPRKVRADVVQGRTGDAERGFENQRHGAQHGVRLRRVPLGHPCLELRPAAAGRPSAEGIAVYRPHRGPVRPQLRPADRDVGDRNDGRIRLVLVVRRHQILPHRLSAEPALRRGHGRPRGTADVLHADGRAGDELDLALHLNGLFRRGVHMAAFLVPALLFARILERSAQPSAAAAPRRAS